MTLDMKGPKTAVCEREMNDVFQKSLMVDTKSEMDKTYFSEMGESQRMDLWKRAYECLQQAATTKSTAFILDQTTWYRAIDAEQQANKTERESIIHDYDALVNRYNSLADNYNTLGA